MNEPARILIHGASGRMGQALLRLAAGRDDLRVVAAVSRSKPTQRVVDGVPQFAVAEAHGVPAFDVAVDFSLPDGFEAVLAMCQERGAGLVSGTTGLDERQQRAIDLAGERVPVLWAANFSLGVAVLGDLVQRAAAALHGWDCDIVGEHTVQLTGPGERLELVHRATDRDVFARGALLAAKRLAGRPPGRYRVADLFL